MGQGELDMQDSAGASRRGTGGDGRWVGGWRRKGKKKQEAAGKTATEHVSTRKRLSVQGGRKGS